MCFILNRLTPWALSLFSRSVLNLFSVSSSCDKMLQTDWMSAVPIASVKKGSQGRITVEAPFVWTKNKNMTLRP